MRRVNQAVFSSNLLLLCFCSTSTVASQSANDTKTLGLDFKASPTFIFFENDEGTERGTQVFAPLSATYSLGFVNLGVKSAYIYTSRDSDFDNASGDISTISDTSISSVVKLYNDKIGFLGNRRISLNLNLDANLPTGTEQLSSEEENAIFDPLLVRQDRFGEGFNFASGLGLTIELTSKDTLGVSGSYITRGAYEPDGDNPDLTLDPGNQLIGTVQFTHLDTRWFLTTGVRVLHELQTDLEDSGFFDRGLSFDVNLAGAYQIAPKWRIQGSAFFNTRARDDFLNIITGELDTTDANTNGEIFVGSLSIKHQFSQKHAIRILGELLYRTENDFDDVDFSFEPERSRWKAGLGYTYTINRSFSFDIEASYFRLNEGNILSFDGEDFRGGIISATISRRF